MKYLKKYEEEQNYNIGDYVIIKSEYFKDKLSRKCKIIDKGNQELSNKICWYECKMINDEIIINDLMVKRKLTPEEIKQFELDISINKYNI